MCVVSYPALGNQHMLPNRMACVLLHFGWSDAVMLSRYITVNGASSKQEEKAVVASPRFLSLRERLRAQLVRAAAVYRSHSPIRVRCCLSCDVSSVGRRFSLHFFKEGGSTSSPTCVPGFNCLSSRPQHLLCDVTFLPSEQLACVLDSHGHVTLVSCQDLYVARGGWLSRRWRTIDRAHTLTTTHTHLQVVRTGRSQEATPSL